MKPSKLRASLAVALLAWIGWGAAPAPAKTIDGGLLLVEDSDADFALSSDARYVDDRDEWVPLKLAAGLSDQVRQALGRLAQDARPGGSTGYVRLEVENHDGHFSGYGMPPYLVTRVIEPALDDDGNRARRGGRVSLPGQLSGGRGGGIRGPAVQLASCGSAETGPATRARAQAEFRRSARKVVLQRWRGIARASDNPHVARVLDAWEKRGLLGELVEAALAETLDRRPR